MGNTDGNILRAIPGMQYLPEDELKDLQTRHAQDPWARGVIEHVQKIQNSSGFARSPRSKPSETLAYVCAKFLLGRAHEITETTLGQDVWRDPKYDPNAASKVREAVSVLRTKLDIYTTAEGRDDPIGISLPRGAFVPQIRQRLASVLVKELDDWSLHGNLNLPCRVISELIAVRLGSVPGVQANISCIDAHGGKAYLVRGSVERLSDEFKVNVSLIDRDTGRTTASDSRKAPVDDLCRLAREVADAILCGIERDFGGAAVSA